jgi:hypothetical protein
LEYDLAAGGFLVVDVGDAGPEQGSDDEFVALRTEFLARLSGGQPT